MISLIPPAELKAKVEAEAGRDPEAFDSAKALNRKGFIEFLEKFGAKPEDLEDNEIAERFEVFEAKDKVGAELKEIYANEIARETGLKFSKDELKCIDAFLEKNAVENPGQVLEFRDQIKQFREFPAQIAQMEQELAKLEDDGGFTARMEGLQEQVDLNQSAQRGTGFWGKLSMYSNMGLSASFNALTKPSTEVDYGGAAEIYHAQQALKKQGVPVTEEALELRLTELVKSAESLKRELEEAETEKKKDIADMKGKVVALKQSLFSHVELRAEVARIATAKINDQIKKLTQNSGLAGYDDAHALLGRSGVPNETGLEYIEADQADTLKGSLNVKAEQAVRSQIQKAVSGMRLGDNAFSRFEDQLRKSLEGKSGTISGKDQGESFEFVLDSIEAEAESLPDSPENRAKKLLCFQMTRKLRAQAAKSPAPTI